MSRHISGYYLDNPRRLLQSLMTSPCLASWGAADQTQEGVCHQMAYYSDNVKLIVRWGRTGL